LLADVSPAVAQEKSNELKALARSGSGLSRALPERSKKNHQLLAPVVPPMAPELVHRAGVFAQNASYTDETA
jgi:hypothetical protein